ncbi:MAG: hypothetical protein J5766_04905 [Clostridia bacterium]|nr:hypothetical protein [Clostridia bacterium]
MKFKTLIIIIGVVALLTACGKNGDSSSSNKGENSGNKSQITNPVTEITEGQAKKIYSSLFRVPSGAKNVKWSVIDSAESSEKNAPRLLEFNFDLDGKSFTAREKKSNSGNANFSGLYYVWSVEDPFEFTDKNGNKLSGEAFRYNGKDECVDLCIWSDPHNGMSYTLSVSAKSLDGFDLQAIVEMITP